MWDTYLKNVRVLIVDDQDFIRSLLRHILGVLGCKQITDAADGVTAWGIIQDTSPDLLIVDWEMSPMNGLELVQKVRHDPISPDKFLPIIMITAHSERPRIITARDSVVNEFVMKPVSAKTLFSRLNAVLEHPRLFLSTSEYFGTDPRPQPAPARGYAEPADMWATTAAASGYWAIPSAATARKRKKSSDPRTSTSR